MKRILAALLCALMLLSALPAWAETVSARTPLSGSSRAKISNIEIAAASINGVSIPYGGRFSFNEIVGPRTAAYGFQSAVNGRGVKVTGGGVAQAASTLYLALKQLNQGIDFTQVSVYGSKFQEDYVASGADAILVDHSSGLDFSFINYGDDLTIEMWMSEDYLYCSLTTGGQEEFIPSLDWSQAPLPDFSTGFSQGFSDVIASAAFPIEEDENLRSNILLAAGSINDTVLISGDKFSFNDSVGPRREKYGYLSAKNGRGVKVTGGGVAQVASVVWLAVKNLDEIAILQKSTYGGKYNQDYVASSNDAILTDYSEGTDFSFRYTGEGSITISTYVSGDMLCCDIYRNG